ncbi:MAG: hypothetical protein K2Q12_05105 [Rickettsiales bacterium]|nr:hypothetical protein [Rickettsiales bacterium]
MHPLLVMALEQEGSAHLTALGYEVLLCGVGKVNATHALTRRLVVASQRHEDIPWVLNLGSAGSHRFSAGQLVEAGHFVQRDMDVRGLGFALGETPFESDTPIIETTRRFIHLPHATCATGDSFVQEPPALAGDIVDMEAYALAKVCQRESVPFACVKYITDGADGQAASDWKTNCARAEQAFAVLLTQYA